MMYQGEEQLQRYLQQHHVHDVLVAVAESICLEQPTDVPKHIIQFLQRHFVSDVGASKTQEQQPSSALKTSSSSQPTSQVQFNDAIWQHSYEAPTPRAENGFAPFTFGNPNAPKSSFSGLSHAFSSVDSLTHPLFLFDRISFRLWR